MTALPASLAGHCQKVLAGTGLTPEDAAAIAADPAAAVPAEASAAAAALRAGWDAAATGQEGPR